MDASEQMTVGMLRMELMRHDAEVVVLGRNNAVRLMLAGTLVDPFRYVRPCWQRNAGVGNGAE